jgi:hypothetical protein
MFMRAPELDSDAFGNWHVDCFVSSVETRNKGSDMKVSRLLIAGTAAALLPFAGAFAQSPSPDPTAQPAQEQRGASFESLDANSDGKISKAEAAVNANVSAQFAKYDQNGDGFIERDEVGSANKSETPKQ